MNRNLFLTGTGKKGCTGTNGNKSTNLNYDQTLAYLYSRLPVFEQIGAAAYKDNLDNTVLLDRRLDHPHKNFDSIHVAGTNGKGSVTHMLAAVLQEAGFRTGLFTSPHMKDFRERIRVNGKCISKEAVIGFTAGMKDLIEEIHPSFFEIATAMAFDYFAAGKVEIAVIETGMGGRLDSTNIITPLVSVITNIGLDHTRFLGNSIRQIAVEKAGIIKYGVPVVIGQTQAETKEVFAQTAGEKNAPLIIADQVFSAHDARITSGGHLLLDISNKGKLQYKRLSCELPGMYQQKNIVTVMAVLDELKKQGVMITRQAVRSGISKVKKLTGLRGRWDVIGRHPLIVCDTAHNEDGLSVVISQAAMTDRRQLHIVFGMVNDKDTEGILKQLPADATYYFTQAGIPRALDRYKLASLATDAGLKGQVYGTPGEALKAARNLAAPEDMILVTGSTFIVAEIL